MPWCFGFLSSQKRARKGSIVTVPGTSGMAHSRPELLHLQLLLGNSSTMYSKKKLVKARATIVSKILIWMEPCLHHLALSTSTRYQVLVVVYLVLVPGTRYLLGAKGYWIAMTVTGVGQQSILKQMTGKTLLPVPGGSTTTRYLTWQQLPGTTTW